MSNLSWSEPYFTLWSLAHSTQNVLYVGGKNISNVICPTTNCAVSQQTTQLSKHSVAAKNTAVETHFNFKELTIFLKSIKIPIELPRKQMNLNSFLKKDNTCEANRYNFRNVERA